MSETAFKFLLQDEGEPYFPSRFYVVADPTIQDRHQWTIELDSPKEGSWAYRIDDMKDWMLHGRATTRQIIHDRSNTRSAYRDLERDEVFRAYLRKLFERLPSEYQERRKYALMPSIADEKTRSRYKAAVEAAIPGITVLPEPEMVAEYFRLVKRTLELEEGRNNVILVVDVGASTANMTLILSRRDRKLLDSDKKGAQRDLRLRALRGDSRGNAGRWVDERLAQVLGILVADETLREIEKAKVKASVTGANVAFDVPGESKPLTLSSDMLASVAGELCNVLRPLFESICERLYENQTSSEDARRLNEEWMRERNVKAPADAYRLIDTVLLAGGTSLLPGFAEALMKTLFPDVNPPKLLRVGSSFAIAAAAGGLAHVLHNYEPPRLRVGRSQNSGSFSAALESTLPYALLLGIKQAGQTEEQITVLDANDPFADDGGVRPIEGLPALATGSQPKARLLPGPAAGLAARRGRQFKPVNVREAPGKMSLSWDPVKEEARIISAQIRDTGHLWIQASGLRKRSEAALEPFEEELEADALAVDGSHDVVLDLGMSKIVAMTAQRGWTSAAELERVMEEGVGTEPVSSTTSPVDNPPEPEVVTVGGGVPFRKADPADSPTLGATDASVGVDANVRQDRISGVNHGSGRTPGGKNRSVPPSRTEPAVNPHKDWGERVPEVVFSNALASLRDAVAKIEPHFYFNDVVVTVLALAVRPIVLLSGPPGCGKSTLVRLIAQMFGKTAGGTFHEVAVQAHWENDSVLFDKGGILEAVLEARDHSHLILFDEFNLTRPEYYLSRIFHALDGGNGSGNHGLKIAPCRVLGTMNIDDFSRPPSPKVIDRCFLLELSQVSWDDEQSGIIDLSGLDPLPGLPAVTFGGAGTDERMERVLDALNLAVHENGLRHDLLPSRRVLADSRAMLSLHHQLDLQAKALLARDELVDRLIASRILVKLSGAIDQLLPALEALEKAVEGVDELVRTRRRLKLARQQARLGFISPWQ
ncbi:AAA family ATPase [Sinorhizobium meliloti]|uniref:AAA family ATPase n=1 Tax=Rhizobium meliloti TaxID=382 RepID=UPI00309C314A